jgi:hypothetical protein
MIEAKDISEVEDFKVEKGDIDDYNHISSSKSVEMDEKFKDIFVQIVKTSIIKDFDTNKNLSIKITAMYQSKIPNHYNEKVLYIKDSEDNFYKLGLLDFHDDDSFVYAKKVEDIDTDSIVAAIPPRITYTVYK